MPQYHRLDLIVILTKDPLLSRLSTSFRTDIMMTLGWTGLRSLRPSLTQVGSGESYILRCFRITDFMRRGTNTGAMMGAAHVVTTSVGMCDVDLRCLFCVINLFSDCPPWKAVSLGAKDTFFWFFGVGLLPSLLDTFLVFIDCIFRGSCNISLRFLQIIMINLVK